MGVTLAGGKWWMLSETSTRMCEHLGLAWMSVVGGTVWMKVLWVGLYG